MSTCSITVQVDEQTLTQLQSNRFTLYAFKAVQGNGQVQPLVWLASTNHSLTTTISWQNQYTVYTSNSPVVSGAVVVANNLLRIGLGQMLVVNNNGTGTVTMGQPGRITIQNQTFSSVTCGLGQANDQSPEALVCATEAFPNMMLSLAPVNKVLLLFSNNQSVAGTVTGTASGDGTLLDLTNSPNATVGFNLNQGWFNSSVPSQSVPAGQNLSQLLIQG